MAAEGSSIENKQVQEKGEFSSENLRAYGEACLTVGMNLAELLENPRGKTVILLPSRGAIPIFDGALLALNEIGLAKKIILPPLSCFEYVRNKIYQEDSEQEKTGKNSVDVLIFPLTADINVSGLVKEEQERDFIDGMRRFGARVVLDFFKSPNRRRSREFNLFLAFLRAVEGRRDIINFYQEFPAIDRLLIIDTVISGRASWTIFDEWERSGKKIGGEKINPILIIDGNGERLKSEFRKYVDSCSSCIKIPRILSEDRGAALEGVVAVVYPGLILAAHGRQDFYPEGYPLFGSWHSVPPHANEIYLGVFNRFLETIEAVIKNDEKSFLTAKNDFLEKLRRSGALATRGEINERELKISHGPFEAEETSAHVLQIYFPEKVQEEIIREILKIRNKGE